MIQATFPAAKLELVLGGGGNFIVDAGGVRLWDKRNMDDEFPDEAVLIEHLKLIAAKN